jgi:hypothetical protein
VATEPPPAAGAGPVTGGVSVSPPFLGGSATRTDPVAAETGRSHEVEAVERPGNATSASAEKTAANATDAASASRVIRATERIPSSR